MNSAVLTQLTRRERAILTELEHATEARHVSALERELDQIAERLDAVYGGEDV